MSWENILKYNREHYVRAGRKHNNPDTIEAHKKILDKVKTSKIKDRKMGRQIRRTLQGLPNRPKKYDMKLVEDENFLYTYLKELEEYIISIEKLKTKLPPVKPNKKTSVEDRRKYKNSMSKLDEYQRRLKRDLERIYSEYKYAKDEDSEGWPYGDWKRFRRIINNHNKNMKYAEETLDLISKFF